MYSDEEISAGVHLCIERYNNNKKKKEIKPQRKRFSAARGV